jgi:hypothetical protein
MPGLMGVFRNGNRVTRGWGCMMFRGSTGRRPTLQPTELIGPEGRRPIGHDTVAWVWERENPETPQDMFSIIPFLGGLRTAAGPDHLFLTRGEAYEIEVYDDEGRLIRILREDALPPVVTEAHREAWIQERAATSRPHPEDVPFSERFGSYQILMLSFEGDLWAQRLARPGEEEQEWVVFSVDGTEVRRVILSELSLKSIRGGRLYGFRTDSLGIQTVEVLDVGG